MMTENKEQKAGDTIGGLYRTLAELIVQFPEDLEVEAKSLQHSIGLSVRCHTDDHGKLIGTAGKTINAFKLLMALAAKKFDKTVHLTQQSPVKGRKLPITPFQQDVKWVESKRTEEIRDLLEKVCATLFTYWAEITYNDFEDSTIFSVTLDPREDAAEDIQELDEALDTIIHAIGKSKGRIIFTDVGVRT